MSRAWAQDMAQPRGPIPSPVATHLVEVEGFLLVARLDEELVRQRPILGAVAVAVVGDAPGLPVPVEGGLEPWGNSVGCEQPSGHAWHCRAPRKVRRPGRGSLGRGGHGEEGEGCPSPRSQSWK